MAHIHAWTTKAAHSGSTRVLVLSRLGRTMALVALTAVIPACGGGGGDGGTPEPIVLLTDTFDGAFPGTNWTFSSNTAAGYTVSGAVDISAIGGNPAPGLRLDVTGPPAPPTPQNPSGAGTAGVSSVAFFNSQGPLTVSFDLKDESGSGLLRCGLYSFGTSDIAVLQVTKTSVLYQINNAGITGPFSSGFHHFVLSIDAAGTTRWSIDGVTQVTGSFPHLNNLSIKFSFQSTNWDTTSMYIDNISVTSP